MSDRTEADRRYYEANRDRVRARQRANYERTREAQLEQQRQYRAANAEERAEADRAYYAAGGDAIRERRRARYAADRAEILARQARYRVENPDREADKRNKRRAAKAGANFEPFSKALVWKRDSGICLVCNQPADPTNWHLDHVVPISLGGSHEWANVAVAHPRCNMEKWRHDPREPGSKYAYVLSALAARLA